jgi:hypothetical protein
MRQHDRIRSADFQGTSHAFGIAETCLVATPRGWHPLGGLQPGDALYTLNAGAIPLIGLTVPSQLATLPAICLPAGSFGNRSTQCLMPGQTVLLQSDVGEQQFGCTDTLLPALALLGWRGAYPRPAAERFLIPRFASEALIYAGPGLILSCPDPVLQRAGPAFGAMLAAPGIPRLSLQQGLDLVNCLIAEDVGAALGARLQAAC